MPDLLGGVLDTAIALTGADFGNIQLLDPDGRIRIVAHRHCPAWWVEYWNTAGIEHDTVSVALATGKCLLVEDVGQSPLFADSPALAPLLRAGIHSLLSMPVRTRSGQMLGILSTHYRTPHLPDAKALEVLDPLAAHTATLIECTREEKTVGEIEAQYRAVVETSADGFWMLDDEGRIRAVNEIYALRSGYSREELLTLHASDLDTQESAEEVEQHRQKVRRQGADLFETAHRTKSGEVWPVEVNVTYRPESGGRYFAFLRDISDRKRLEAELRKSEERYRLAMEAAVEGIWDWDMESGQIHFSPGYAAMLGYEPRESQTHFINGLSLVHPDDAQALLENAYRLQHDQGRFAIEFRLRRKDGGYCRVLGQAKVVERNTAGKPRRAIGTLIDITERKQLEEALAKRERKLRALADSSPGMMGSFYLRPDGTLCMPYVSANIFDLFGLRPEDVTENAAPLMERTHPDDAPRVADTIAESARTLTTWHCEYRIQHPLKGERWMEGHTNPQPHPDGGTIWYGYVHDITERKRREAEAQRHNELIQTLARQQVAVQTAAAFAHELNQPLVAIAAYSEVALHALHSDNPKANQLAHAIEGSHAQAMRAGQVLHDLMDHLHNGESDSQPFDLNGVVVNIVEKTRKAEYRVFQAKLNLEPDLPPVLGNRLQTEKVLVNLLQNGIEAMEEAGVSPAAFTISVRTHASKQMAHVTVRDNGPGLDADTAARIFDPFFSTKPNGLGLGLAISRSLIEAQGGQLWLDPEDGPGAVFHLTLPFAHE